MGITNDLIVVGSHDDIYITTYLPERDLEKGREKSLSYILRLIIPLFFRIKRTYIYHCESSHLRNTNISNSHFKCMETTDQESLSLLNNGINFDEENNLIFVSNLIERRIRVFKRDPNNKINLKYLNDIKIGYAGDNVLFKKNEKNGNFILTVGVIGRLIDHIKLIENSKNFEKILDYNSTYFGAVKVEIDKNTNFEDSNELVKNTKVDLLVMQNNLFKGISSSYEINDKVYMTSWLDDGIFVCKVKNVK